MLISTKAVGKFDRDDITHTYKYPESMRRFLQLKQYKYIP